MRMIIMKLRLVAALLSAALALAGLSACSAQQSTGKLSVVTAFYPLAFIAESVGGDAVQVSNLTQPGAEPHDLELTAQQIASISSADLVVYQKGFQAAVDQAIEANPPQHALDVSSLVTMMDQTSSEGSGTDGHTESQDPHTWLDPNNMKAFATGVDDALSGISPAHKDAFEKNTAAVIASLTTLDTDFSTGLAHCERKEFITSHAAFGYLAKRYGLTQIGIAGLDPSVEPSTGRIAEIQQLAKRYGVTTIFYETLASPAVAKSLASDLGLKTDILDPLEGITDQSLGTNYIEVMGSNLTALKKANSCT